ncbi:MAG: VWA domain-containing protein [Acidobacteria bacterium]|nr:VWA domain-containing protein [Acidobacteriota bacterium]
MRFLRPDLLRWWLVIPVLVASWAIHWQATRAFRRRVPVADRFGALSRRSTWRREAGVLTAAALTAAALVFALMRPQVLLARRVADYERQDLIVMLDRSMSMRARDVAPSRFARAALELRNFLRQKPEGIDRIGVVGFADSAVVLSYLTADTESVLFYLDWLDEDARETSAMFGTNIGAALRSARDIARKDDRVSRKLFLVVSDGEDYGTELRDALETFRSEGLRVDTIGIGSDAAAPIPLPTGGQETFLLDDAGRRVTTTFEEATLVRVAATTGGRFIRSTTGTELARALAEVAKGERKQVGWRTTTEYRDIHWVGLAAAAMAGAALWLLL